MKRKKNKTHLKDSLDEMKETKEYWEIYESIQEIFYRNGINDEDRIHAEVEKIINRNSGREMPVSTTSKSSNN